MAFALPVYEWYVLQYSPGGEARTATVDTQIGCQWQRYQIPTLPYMYLRYLLTVLPYLRCSTFRPSFTTTHATLRRQ